MVLLGVPAVTAPIGRISGRYAVEVGGKPIAPSVTGVLGVLNKPGLSWGSAKETALFAIHHQDEWIDLSPEDAYHRLRKHHRGVWNDKAARGTAVHALAVEWAEGREVECPPECAPYLDALERLYVDHRPAWVELERSVVYAVPGLEFGGSLDAIVDVGGRRLVIDIKTGQRYPIETTVQLAAYRHAQGMGVYSPLGGLEAIEPMPEVDGAAILYLHDDGSYELLDVPADRLAFDTFLALRRVWGWLEQMRAWEKRTPAPRREAVSA
jgi:hypothetical protein